MAILDPLIALHNRRYMTSHLKTLFEEAAQRDKPAFDAAARHRSLQVDQ